MKNLFISDLNKKDVDHFTSDIGLKLRKEFDVPFKKMCNIFTNANIIMNNRGTEVSDSEYFNNLSDERLSPSTYDIKNGKNNIVVERYPKLESDESYIFVCNHTCPEDIETVLNVIDRNAYLVLGSIESLKYNPEMYLLWLNGMIPFDILDENERKELLPKMKRVLKTNSVLIFPEGSHNYHPNKIINNLFDGPVNAALNTGKKIVIITMVKDKENNISYIDVSNPVDVCNLDINISDYYPSEEKKEEYEQEKEKYYVKSLSCYLRDKMATAVYYIIARYIDVVIRDDYQDIDSYFIDKYIQDAFSNLKWTHDVFDAEYLVKKTSEDKDYEEAVRALNNLNVRDYSLLEADLDRKDVASYMRDYWENNYSSLKKKVKK